MPSHTDDPLNIATDAAALLLEAGSETFRAEDCVVRLSQAWGLEGVECFAMPTGLIASVNGRSMERCSIVRRISTRNVDLDRIAKLSALIEQAESGSLDVRSGRLAVDAIRKAPLPALGPATLASAACAAFFALLFGGALPDALSAAGAGALIALVRGALARRAVPDFLMYIICGMITAALAVTLNATGFLDSVDLMIIASIMLLVPGLSTVTAIRDTIAGDLVAGVARLAEAFITAAAISMGVVIPLALERMLLL